MSQISRVHQIPPPRPIPVLATINVIVALTVLALLGWAVTLNKRNKELEKKVEALEGGGQAGGKGKGGGGAAGAAGPTGKKGQPIAATTTGGTSRKRRRAATAASPATTGSPATTRVANPGGAATQPRQAITDAELARIEKVHQAIRESMEQGRATVLDVLRAQRLLNRAKFLHGDLTAQQYQEQSDRVAVEASAHLLALEQAGRVDNAKQLEFYEQLLLERR